MKPLDFVSFAQCLDRYAGLVREGDPERMQERERARQAVLGAYLEALGPRGTV